jgi:hypothetical protein
LQDREGVRNQANAIAASPAEGYKMRLVYRVRFDSIECEWVVDTKYMNEEDMNKTEGFIDFRTHEEALATQIQLTDELAAFVRGG